MVLANGGRYIGDYGEDSLVVIPFDTTDQTGNKVTRTAVGTIKIYKNGSTTEKTTANGVTDTNDFDSQVGINLVTIDTSNDTGDVGFWAPGNDYMVMLIDATVDTKTVSLVLGHFSLENRVTDVVRINGSRTNSNDAVLKLKQLDITHDSNDHALILKGNGTGSGLYSEGGATGIGIEAKGGATSGDGMNIKATTLGRGLTITGAGTREGVFIESGTNGSGMWIQAHGSTNYNHGLYLRGEGSGSGMFAWGGNDGNGMTSQSGSIGGHGIHAIGGGGTIGNPKNGIFSEVKNGYYGYGIDVFSSTHAAMRLRSSNAQGLYLDGGSGAGLYCKSSVHAGVQIEGGTNSAGLLVLGNGSGSGIFTRGGTTGIGVEIEGGSSSGTALSCVGNNGTAALFEGNGSGGRGIKITSDTSFGVSIEAYGSGGIQVYGSGPALSLASGSEVAAIFSGGSPNKDGIVINSQGSGHGIRVTSEISGHGIYAAGGSDSGTGIYAHGRAPNGVGIEASGSGSGKGMLISNTSTAGVGMKIQGGNGGSGLFLDVKDGNGHGIRTVGIGTGSGISSESDATGFSISTIGGIKVISNSNQHGMLIQGDGVSHAGLKLINTSNKDIDAKEITDILDDTNEIQSKLPVGSIAGSDDVESILNNTRFVASVPSYFLIPATGNNVYELKVHFYNDAGSMEDPNFNEFSIRTRTVDGTVKNALLYKEYAATNPLDVSTIFSGYLSLERITVGIYHCYIKIASTETDTQFLYDFACQEGVYAVTFIEGANGSITGEKIQSIDPNGDCEPVTAVPDTGYHFNDWSGDIVSSDNPLTVTNVISDMNITADFAINEYDVTFIEGADGSITGDKNQVIDHGSDCTSVEAVPDVDFVFDGWTGDITSSDNPLTVTNVTGDLDITANFASADINPFAFNNDQQQNNNNE